MSIACIVCTLQQDDMQAHNNSSNVRMVSASAHDRSNPSSPYHVNGHTVHAAVRESFLINRGCKSPCIGCGSSRVVVCAWACRANEGHSWRHFLRADSIGRSNGDGKSRVVCVHRRRSAVHTNHLIIRRPPKMRCCVWLKKHPNLGVCGFAVMPDCFGKHLATE